MFSDFFSPENRPVYEKAENMVEPERPQMTSQHGAYALHAEQARLHARIYTRPSAWATTQTHAHKHTHKYVILIDFPWQ